MLLGAYKDAFESRMSFMGSGLDRIFGQVVSTRIKTLSNTNLVVSSQIIIKGKGITPGWRVSLRNDFALNFPNHIFWVTFLFSSFFTSFSGHTPAQRECARTGLRGPFLESPVTFRARNQVFKSKYKEWGRRSWLANYSVFFFSLTDRGFREKGPRSHARCHPYPIPQLIKAGHTTGVYTPTLFE